MANSAEAVVVAALAGIGVKVYPDVAPSGAERPYVTYQAVGGQDVNDLSGPADLENQRMQINVWSATRAATVATMRSARAALVAAGALPIGAPVSDSEQDTQLYGSRLDFSIWFKP
ncbi:uncharacterized protein DUF3168 [Cupriavidus alkaliphilus]|uniref:tail completion protein gp17 n=1 Tax=Cupriavidus alkaliphilus TaxID=942866 RepID=UPI000DE6CB25|nr:DUF3168 domain-containing protein [Cupriavidus alkaliphilus]PVY81059.1 uncharacterized protein DUF3168 [Cupriavidus alkaliphilus]